MKEITLLGQNVNSYGVKDGDISFPELLEKVSKVDGIQRIRFATSQPDTKVFVVWLESYEDHENFPAGRKYVSIRYSTDV